MKIIKWIALLVCFSFLTKISFGFQSFTEVNMTDSFPSLGDLTGIVSIDFDGEYLAVVTGYEPFIHIYKKRGSLISFGRKGNGPGELSKASNIQIVDDKVFVIDFEVGDIKLLQFSLSGELISEELLSQKGIEVSSKIESEKSFSIIETSKIFSSKKTLMYLSQSGELNELLEFSDPKPERLNIVGGPMQSMSISNPFLPHPTWATSNDGVMYYWNGESSELLYKSIFSFEDEWASLSIPEIQVEIEKEDFEAWIDEVYPENVSVFGYSDFNKNVRKEIRDHIKYPTFFPDLQSIKIEKNGKILWMLRGSKVSGDVWTYYNTSSGVSKNLTLPVKERLVTFTDKLIVVSYLDENEEKRFKFYDKEELFDINY